MMRTLLQKPRLGLSNLNNYKQMFNIPYLVELVKNAVLLQLQELLETVFCQHPRKSKSRPGPNAETVFIILIYNLYWEKRMKYNCVGFTRSQWFLLSLSSVSFNHFNEV